MKPLAARLYWGKRAGLPSIAEFRETSNAPGKGGHYREVTPQYERRRSKKGSAKGPICASRLVLPGVQLRETKTANLHNVKAGLLRGLVHRTFFAYMGTEPFLQTLFT